MKNIKSKLIPGLIAVLITQGFTTSAEAQNYLKYPILLTPGKAKFVACEVPDSNFIFPNSTPASEMQAFTKASKGCAKSLSKKYPGLTLPTLAKVSGFILPTALGTGPLPANHSVFQYVEVKNSKYQKNCSDKLINKPIPSYVEKFQMPNLDVHMDVSCCSADLESAVKSYTTHEVELWTAVLPDTPLTKGLVPAVGENASANIPPKQPYEMKTINGIQTTGDSLEKKIKQQASLNWGYTFERDECLTPPETQCGPHSHCIKGWYKKRLNATTFGTEKYFERKN